MSVDAILLGLLAIADLAVLAHLRHRRWEATQKERLMRSLVLAIRRENDEIPMPEPPSLAKAS